MTGAVTASLRHCITALLACGAFAAHAQGWTPQRNVEIVVTSAPGGSNDRTARQVEMAIVESRLTAAPHVAAGRLRAVMGPRGLAPAQVAYWEGVLRKATQLPEWRADLERNYWSDEFIASAQFRAHLDRDYDRMKAVLTELGLAKTATP